MIKESKLIGTQVPMPYGWREFKVGDLFDIMATHALNYDLLQPNGDYPYVVRSAQNNGIREFMNYDTAFLNEGNVITLGIDTASYFYQASDFFAGVKVKSLRLKHHELNPRIAMFLIPLLQKQAGDYGYAGGKAFKTAELAEVLIKLPVTQDGQPYYGWMSAYIRELENQRIRELDTYLQVAGLDDTTLTDNELQVLEQWRQHEKFGGGTLATKRFKVGELFDLENSPVTNVNALLVGQVSAGEGLYGVSNMITTGLYDNHIITISKLGQTFYHNENVTWTDDVLGLKLKYRNDMIGLFLSTIIDKQTRRISSYGHQFRMKRLDELSIELPVINDGTPDYDFMETFIRAQEKLVMTQLSDFRAKQIAETKALTRP